MRWHLLAAGLVLTCLLCFDLGGRCLWTDESYSLSAGGPLPDAALTDASHPPGYQLLLHYWLHLVPQVPHGQWGPSASDSWLRLFSIPWALLAWWLGWLIAGRLGLRREGVPAAWLMAISPLVLTYFRLGRYYSLTAALTMLALWALLWLWERPRWARALAAGLALAALGYTDYTALALVCVVVALAGVLALARREYRAVGAFLGAGVVGAALLLPLFSLTVRRASAIASIAADPMAHSVRGLLIKLTLPVFSLATGECVDPWRWAITVPALVVTAGLLALGLWALLRRDGALSLAGAAPTTNVAARRLFALAWPLNILIATAMLSTVAANVPPNRVTSLTMLTIPLAYLLLATGLTRLRRQSVAAVCLLVLVGVSAVGVVNYFRGEQLLNPGYAPPWREVARLIEEHEQPGKEQILLPDEGFPRYYEGRLPILQSYGLIDTARAWEAGTQLPRGRFWLITRDRGSQEMLDQTRQIRTALLKNGYRVEQTYRVQPRSVYDKNMRTLVLRRPAWEAYVIVYLLTRPEPPGP